MAAEAVQQQGAAAILTAMESCMIVESREFPLLASALGRSISVRVLFGDNIRFSGLISRCRMPF